MSVRTLRPEEPLAEKSEESSVDSGEALELRYLSFVALQRVRQMLVGLSLMAGLLFIFGTIDIYKATAACDRRTLPPHAAAARHRRTPLPHATAARYRPTLPSHATVPRVRVPSSLWNLASRGVLPLSLPSPTRRVQLSWPTPPPRPCCHQVLNRHSTNDLPYVFFEMAGSSVCVAVLMLTSQIFFVRVSPLVVLVYIFAGAAAACDEGGW